MNLYRKPLARRTGATLLALLFGLLGLLPTASVVRAEEAKPTLQVLEVGWDGHVTTGAWAPIRVRLNGSARDLDGLVEVTLESQYQTGPNTTVRFPLSAYAQEVSLPASASKEVTLWVPPGHGLLGTVRLKVGDEELGTEEIQFRMTKSPFWPLVGVLADDESLKGRLGKIQLPLQNLPTEINVAQLKPEALPTQAVRLKGLRALVVQGNAPSKLSEGQRAAIFQWIQAGGHLLLAGGPDSALSAAALPAGSLPVTFGGAELNVDLDPLLTWTGGGTLLASTKGPAVKMKTIGGTLLAGTAEQPLAWRIGAGMGSITVLAVDPTLEPLASWDGSVGLLKKALEPAFLAESQGGDEKFRMMMMEQEMSQRLRNTIDALPTDAFPGWKQVLLYLGSFALLAGPLIHLLFWQGRRRSWVWLAVPVASLLVAGSIYGVGVAMGGRDLLGNTLSYVQIDPASQTASQSLMVGLYAPMHPNLTVTLDPTHAASAMGLSQPQWGPWGPQQLGVKEPPFRMVNGRETRLEFRGNEGAMRPIAVSRSLGSEVGRIASSLKLEGDLIRGTITNETPYHLEHAAVAVGGKAARLGELAPGATVEVVLEPRASTQPLHWMPIQMLFFGEPLSPEEQQRRGPVRPGMPEQLQVPQEPEIQRRARLLESMLYRPKAGPDSTSLPLTFIAFTREPVGSPVVDLRGHPDHHLNLIEQRLQLELPAGPFTLPSTLIPSEMAMNNVRGMGSGGNGTITWLEIDSGSVSFTFTPPLPKEARITALEVTTRMMGDPVAVGNGPRGGFNPNEEPQAATGGVFQIYNWQRAAWENLPGGQESVRLTDPVAYLGPQNEVRVQVAAQSGMLVRVVTPSISLEGRGEQ
ncbi:MAG: hypothetical protein ACOY94_25620 [Bacillota bacterium]